jgi:hypothetical protein
MKQQKEVVAFRLPVEDIKNLRHHLMDLLCPQRGSRLFEDDYYSSEDPRDIPGANRVVSDMISQLNPNYPPSGSRHDSDDR